MLRVTEALAASERSGQPTDSRELLDPVKQGGRDSSYCPAFFLLEKKEIFFLGVLLQCAAYQSGCGGLGEVMFYLFGTALCGRKQGKKREGNYCSRG